MSAPLEPSVSGASMVDAVLAATLAGQPIGVPAASVQADTYSSAGGRHVDWNRRWLPSKGNAAADTLRALPDLRARSRDLVRGHALAASAVNTNVLRAVGTGLAFSAQPQRHLLGWSEDYTQEWKRRVHAEFSLWADSPLCDLEGKLSFYDLQDLVLRSMLESGDVFVLMPDEARSATMPYALRLQVLEADRVGNPRGVADTPEVAGGIRRGRGGAWSAFVYDRHPGARTGVPPGALHAGRWVDAIGRSGRRRILHVFKTLRPEQPRGVPYLAPVMQLFRDLGLFTENEIKAAVSSAALTFFVESAADAQGGTPLQPDEGREESIELEGANAVHLLPGEKIASPNPGRPNPAFGPFVEAVLLQLGAGTFIGLEMLVKRYNTSYTAARAAFLDAWRHFLDMRTRIVRGLCQPVVETWMAEAVAIGRVAAPGFFSDPLLRWAYTRAVWSGDSQGSLNPKDEVAAYLDAVDGRLISRERAEWELFGTDWGETYDTKKTEHDRLAADGLLPVPRAGRAAPVPSPSGDARA